jgi:diguanylate cyclase (GGDEF)-like protein
MVLTSLLMFFTCDDREGFMSGLVISAIVPGIVAPSAGHVILKLLIELDQTRAQLKLLATRDSLTGSLNRYSLLQAFEHELQRAQSGDLPLSVLLVDVDDFKQINDQHGHAVGDCALQHLVSLCSQVSRRDDLFARYGGEEFVLLLPGAPQHRATEVAERLCQWIAQNPLELPEHPGVPLTVSIGVASLTPGDRDTDTVLARADAALYAAKNAGRNRWSV